MTARFTLGERVITPQNGEGEIVLVYPSKAGRIVTYGVSVKNNRAAVIYEERELTAAAFIPEGKTVRCIDCIHARKSNYLHNTVRCAAFCRAKSAQSQRLCNRFKPLPVGAVLADHPLDKPEA
jgi:hypothetical protein